MSTLNELGLGTLFAGNAGLLQLLVLPGLILYLLLKRGRFSLPAIDAVLLVVVSSGVFSFLCVLLLQSLGWHEALVWKLLGWLEAFAIASLVVRSKQLASDHAPQQLTLPSILGLLVFLFCFLELVSHLVSHWPGVLEGWDAIVSWNRWARDWAAGRWPTLTWNYPQLIPASWSVLYLWLGSTEIEPPLRIYMGMFALGLVAVFLAAFVHWRRWPLLLAGAGMTAIAIVPFRQVLDTGYVDLPLAFTVALTAHWALLALAKGHEEPQWLWMATLSTGYALLIKQGGVLALVFWLWSFWSLRGNGKQSRHCLVLLMVLVIPWYGLQLWHGSDESVISYVMRDIYGAETLGARLVRALGRTLPEVLGIAAQTRVAAVILFVTILGILLGMKDRYARLCGIVALAGLLAWAMWFSYDGRNLLPTVPVLLMAVAHGYGHVQSLPRFLADSLVLRPVAIAGVFQRVFLILTFTVLIGAFLPQNVARWEQHTDALRMSAGDPEFNQELLAYVSAPGFSGKIYTTYSQVPAISELRRHWFNDRGASHMLPSTRLALQQGAPFCEVRETIAGHEEIQHVLLHESVYPAMTASALEAGSLQVEIAKPGLKLMRVNCPFREQP